MQIQAEKYSGKSLRPDGTMRIKVLIFLEVRC